MLSEKDLEKVYYLPDNMPSFVLLTRSKKDNRFKIYESGDKASDVIAKVIAEYDEGDERERFIKKIMDKVKAFEVIKK